MPKKQTVLIVFLIIIGLGLSSCQMEQKPTKVGSLSPPEGPETNPETASTSLSIYQIGDMVSINNTLIIVLGWDQPPGGDFNPPGEGKEYLVVDLMLANQGENSFSISPAFQMSLKDETGQKYNLNGKANTAAGANPPRGEINPGEVIRGKVGFQVKKESQSYQFVYEDKLVGFGEITVNLGSKPIAMNPPTDLNLDFTKEVFEIGEEIVISDLQVSILGVSRPTGNNLIKPREDYQFLVVDITIENKGETVREISSVLQMYVKDATGQQYTFNLGAQSFADGGLPDDELQPGEKVRGQIGFEVAENVSPYTFVFDAEIFGYGKIFIQLPE